MIDEDLLRQISPEDIWDKETPSQVTVPWTRGFSLLAHSIGAEVTFYREDFFSNRWQNRSFAWTHHYLTSVDESSSDFVCSTTKEKSLDGNHFWQQDNAEKTSSLKTIEWTMSRLTCWTEDHGALHRQICWMATNSRWMNRHHLSSTLIKEDVSH